MEVEKFIVKAPGRVFLFGEHSDYIGLEVISMALNKVIEVNVEQRNDNIFSISYEDIEDQDKFEITKSISYRHKRDYVRSCFNVMKKEGYLPITGANLKIKGEIPIAAGLSSSSALSVAAIITFSQLADIKLEKEKIVELAFKGEVIEFGESGGMMDHYSSAFGGIIHVDFGEKITLTEIPVNLTGFIIGDSQQKKKDTVGDIRMIRTTVEKGYRELAKLIPDFNHRKTSLEKIEMNIEKIPKKLQLMTLTSIKNRDLTREALQYLQKGKINPNEFGKMIEKHHKLLRDGFKRSTKKIEKMIVAAKDAGALGCKINGSGKGGTILAYAPGSEEEVSQAIKEENGVPYKIKTDLGARVIY